MKKLKSKILIVLFIVIVLVFIFSMYQKRRIYIKSIEGMKVTLLGGSNIKENGNTNSAGYIIRSRNGELIIVDGGLDTDYELVLNYINKFGNGTVNHWFITHPHGDHIGALVEVINNDNNVQIENIYYSFNDLEWYEEYDNRGFESEEKMIKALDSNKIINRVSCKKNQIIEMDNISCEIIRLANPKIIHSDNGNDSSMVFKMTATDVDKSIIFLGDAFHYTSKELMEEPEKLKADAVQMAHHGQNGASKEVYEAIAPDICFFNCPEWLYNNDNGEGYNSGKWKTIEVRGWVDELGAKSYKAFEGDQTIRFTSDGFEKVEEKL